MKAPPWDIFGIVGYLKELSKMREEYLEILVEEKSMGAFLEVFLPKLLPTGFSLNENCFVRTHNGKQDLQKKIPTILKSYKRYPFPVRLMVIHDQDSANCIELKNKIIDLIEKNSERINYLVRIACKELENWYLGDLESIEHVYPNSKASSHLNKAKFRNPDLLNGTEEMEKFSIEFSKINCAREMAKVISISKNKSHSFNQFCIGIQKITQ
jgi:hypothetical protein